MDTLSKKTMHLALKELDQLLSKKITLIIGGGSAMTLAHGHMLATADIDAISKGIEIKELDLIVKKIAAKLDLPSDWLNPYFSTFAHTLPKDYSKRLITVFEGKNLVAQALGKEEMLIMKCFAHRQKDVGHAKALLKKGVNINFVRARIEELEQKGIPDSDNALDFLDDLLDQTE